MDSSGVFLFSAAQVREELSEQLKDASRNFDVRRSFPSFFLFAHQYKLFSLTPLIKTGYKLQERDLDSFWFWFCVDAVLQKTMILLEDLQYVAIVYTDLLVDTAVEAT